MAQMKDDVCNVNRPSPQKLTTIKLKKRKKITLQEVLR